MIRSILTALFTIGFVAAQAGEPGPLQGDLTKVDLITGSKNQPALAVLAGEMIYYAEGKNLESTKPEDCPAVDLYKFNLKDKKEIRVAEVSCVVNLLSDGSQVYVVHRADKELLVAKVGVDDKLTVPAEEYLPRAKARVAFKRSNLKLPRGVDIKLVSFVVREKELSAVLQAGEHLFLDSVVFSETPKQALRVIPLTGLHDGRLALSTSIFSFTKGNEGWLRVVETSLDGKSAVLGHQRPLAKTWTECGPLDWAVRNPKFLTSAPHGFLVADRTSEAFTEATAISYYSGADKKFYRLRVPDQDVGGLFYVAEGVLISKPMTGSIVWYGKKNPFQVEDKK